MYNGLALTEPVFELGLKAYLHGKEALELARAADRISGQHGVTIVLTPQYVDIPRIAPEMRSVLVFAQHCDPLEPGRGIGSVLPEALKDAGAAGVLLNHSERRLTLSDISNTIRRCDAVGLATMVCADSPEEAAAVACLHPNAILAEPPALIGTDESVGREKAGFIARSLEMVKSIDPKITVLCSAGIRTPEDVAAIIRMGVGGTGSTSGVLKAPDPSAMLEDMVKAVKKAWRETHGQQDSAKGKR